MLNKDDKILLDLINLQMKPFSIHYDSIKGIPHEFCERFETTKEQEEIFIKEAYKYLTKKKYGATKRIREEIISWFILDYGLKTKQR